jgi:5-methylthioadenosine/S-adenosylhomocysteine deaminase
MPIRPENLTSNIVYNVNGSDVTDVYVDGQQVMKERSVTTVDVPSILQDCQMRAQRIWKTQSRNWT